MEYHREPCPWRVIDDYGATFTMGAVSGTFFQSLIGFRNAPSGIQRRLLNSVNLTKKKVPKIAGNFAAWGGLFSAIECTLAHYRAKEDPWNAVASGAISSGILSARNGISSMIGNAIAGAILIAIIEGVGIMVTHLNANQYRQRNFMEESEINLDGLKHIRSSRSN